MDKQLIKVEVNQNNEQAVSARELHEKLGIQKRFSAWWADQIERLNLKENYDYCTSRYTNANTMRVTGKGQKYFYEKLKATA